MCYVMRGTPAVFVFGSNLSGAHGAGAALFARRKRGAQLGVGVGRTGCSYALPTKGFKPSLPVLPLERVRHYAEGFKSYAAAHPELLFQLTAVGCGLAGYSNEQIAPLFAVTSFNVLLPPEWREILADVYPPERFWDYAEVPA